MPVKCKQCGRLYLCQPGNKCLDCEGTEFEPQASVQEREARRPAPGDLAAAAIPKLPLAPGLPVDQQPTENKYLARRRSDGTHWVVAAINYMTLEVALLDYKNPKQGEPVIEPFEAVELVDKQPLFG